MRILIADDCNLTRLILARSVRRWGYEVVEKEDGDEALECLLRERDLHLAIIDWEMPRLDGPSVCRALIEAGCFVYVILLTGRVDKESMALALEAGASDYVTKPFNAAELQARLRAAERLLKLQSQVLHMQKMDSIGRLSAGIAHEFNTPAQFVTDNLRFLQEACGDLVELAGKTRALATSMREGVASGEVGEELTAFCDEIDLDFLNEEIPRAIGQSLEGIEQVSRIVATMKQLSHPEDTGMVSVDVNDTLRAALSLASNEWRYVAEAELELDPELPQMVGHPGEITQVLLNLITNAAQAIGTATAGNGETQGRITLRTRCDADLIEISIADTGSGISSETQERMFDPFFTTKDVGVGTGQGLAVVHEVVRRYGGSIAFETELGVGTTFTLLLPQFPAVPPTSDQAA